MIAALPMYDWPEVRAETDALWAALRDGLREGGFAAPEELTRGGDPWSVWRSPDLVLAQTCGLPFAARLTGAVTLLGAPVYSLLGCPAGTYCSEIVVRVDDKAQALADLRGRRLAFNMRESQSGWAALDAETAIAALTGELVETGAHRASIVAVAEGRADFAAIDSVAWVLALRHEPAAERLRVVHRTAPTPGLPYITRLRVAAEAEAMAGILEQAIEALPATVKQTLALRGFRRWQAEDYAPLAKGWPES